MEINTFYNRPVNFQSKHLPKSFPSLMNRLYSDAQKQCPDVFEYSDIIQLSASLKNGKQITGTVTFYDGEYAGLKLDKKYEPFREAFKKTIIEKYNKAVAKGRTLRKLGYDA